MRIKAISIIVLAMLVVPLSYSLESHGPSAAPAVVWAANVAGDCILKCYPHPIGMGCSTAEDYHVAKREGDTHEYGAGWHDTSFPGTCTEEHPPFLLAAAAFSELKTDILDGAPRARFVALARKYPDHVQLTDGALSMRD